MKKLINKNESEILNISFHTTEDHVDPDLMQSLQNLRKKTLVNMVLQSLKKSHKDWFDS